MLLLSFLFALAWSNPPNIKSATSVEKKVVFQGIEHSYNMYTIDFDQDVYFAENWPCPCLVTEAPYHGEIKSEITSEALPLEKGIWTQASIDGEALLFKFYLDPEMYDVRPIVQIYLGNHWGETNAYVSAGRVPTPANYDFTKYAKARDSLWICPTETGWHWGWWYVLAIRNEPYDNNHFQISWNTTRPALCRGKELTTPSNLINNVGYYGVAQFFVYQYFTFVVETECTNFAVSVKQTTLDFGDLDLYVSLNFSTPNIDHHDYASQNNGNDAITLVNICGQQAPWNIYIGLYIWQGNDIPFVLTATTDTGFQLRPVAELPAQQFLFTFAYGQAQLECAKDLIRCEFYSYAGCLDPYDIWNCCARFGFLPPHEDPFPWVVVPAQASGGAYKPLPWSEVRLPTLKDNVPGRLVFMQYLHRETTTSARVYSQADSCQINFRNMLTNAQGEPLPNKVTFSAPDYECLPNPELTNVIERMSLETKLGQLKILDIQLSAALQSQGMLGCAQQLNNLLVSKQVKNVYQTTTCSGYGPSQPEYYQDPCCSWNLTLTDCCLSREINIPSIKVSKVSDDFSCDECARNRIENYLQKQKPTLQCLREWRTAVGSVDTIANFVYSCAVSLFGPFEFLGKYCTRDADCLYGASCEKSYGRCAHTLQHLQKCWWEKANTLALQALFDYWQVSSAISEEVFYQQLERYRRPLCTGPGSSGFRAHYAYRLTLPTCVDNCVKNNITVQCYNTAVDVCPKDPVCPPGSATNCYRFFQFFAENNNANCAYTKIYEGCYDCSLSMKNNGTCTKLLLSQEECALGIEQPSACSLFTINNQEDCLKANYCAGLDKLSEYLSPRQEGCFEPFTADFYGSPMCGLEYADNPWGCYQPNLSQTNCSGRWLNTNICSTQLACYTGSFFNHQDEETCLCSGNEWRPLFTMQYATWQPAKKKDLVWNPVLQRQVENTLDYLAFFNDVTKAVGKLVALNYHQNALCRAQGTLDLYQKLNCECFTTVKDAQYERLFNSVATNISFTSNVRYSNQTCAEQTQSTTLQMAWLCPFLETNLTTQEFSLLVQKNTVPANSFCQVLSVRTLPISFYGSVPATRLSSQAFTEPPANEWSVLFEKNFLVQGQVVTDSFLFDWNFTALQPLQVCLALAEVERSELFSEFFFGLVVDDQIIVQDMALQKEENLCFNITQAGTYIGLKTRSSNYDSLLAQCIIASILYWILAIGVLYQIVNIVLGKPIRWKHKLAFALLTLLFLTIRGVYFIIYPLGIADPTISYIFFEFPTFLFMMMNSVLVFLWIEVTYTVKRLEPSAKFSSRLFILWTSWNVFILLCFVAFVVAHYYSTGIVKSRCFLLESNIVSEEDLIINRVYVCFVAAVCVVLALSMCYSGHKLVKPHMGSQTLEKSAKITNFLMRTWGLMFVFTVTFLVRSVLMIVAVFAQLIIPVIVFALLEQIATAVLLYYLRPPTSQQIKSLTGSKTTTTPRTSGTGKSGGKSSTN